MHNAKELENLEQIKTAISQLDPKGTNETVTRAMTIVSIAAELIGKGQSVRDFDLLEGLKKAVKSEP